MSPNQKAKKVQQYDTPSEPLIADMYERWTLDYAIIKVVQAIARDFYSRPRQYRQVKDDIPENRQVKDTIPEILQNFWYLSGTDPDFPDMQKREMVFWPILGHSDGMKMGTPNNMKMGDKQTSQFHMNATALREIADAFANRQVTTGVDALRRAFRDAVITFRSYLEPHVENAVVRIGSAGFR